jgi:DNA-binding transcriptional ArsR family regulator
MTEKHGKERHAQGLLAIGYAPSTVARQVGMAEQEVEALAREHGPSSWSRTASGTAPTEVTAEADLSAASEADLSAAEERRLSPERTAILELLGRSEKPLGPSAVAEALDMKPQNVRYLLSQLRTAGLVERTFYGKYTAAAEDTAIKDSVGDGEESVSVFSSEETVHVESVSDGEESASEGVREDAASRIAKRKARLAGSGIRVYNATTGGSISWEENMRRKRHDI